MKKKNSTKTLTFDIKISKFNTGILKLLLDFLIEISLMLPHYKERVWLYVFSPREWVGIGFIIL